MQECFVFLLDRSVKFGGGTAAEQPGPDAASQLRLALCAGPLHTALLAPKPEAADTGVRAVAAVLAAVGPEEGGAA